MQELLCRLWEPMFESKFGEYFYFDSNRELQVLSFDNLELGEWHFDKNLSTLKITIYEQEYSFEVRTLNQDRLSLFETINGDTMHFKAAMPLADNPELVNQQLLGSWCDYYNNENFVFNSEYIIQYSFNKDQTMTIVEDGQKHQGATIEWELFADGHFLQVKDDGGFQHLKIEYIDKYQLLMRSSFDFLIIAFRQRELPPLERKALIEGLAGKWRICYPYTRDEFDAHIQLNVDGTGYNSYTEESLNWRLSPEGLFIHFSQEEDSYELIRANPLSTDILGEALTLYKENSIVYQQIKEFKLAQFENELLGEWFLTAVGTVDAQIVSNYKAQLPPPYKSKQPAAFHSKKIIPYYLNTLALWALEFNDQHYQFKEDGVLFMNEEETEWAITEDGVGLWIGNTCYEVVEREEDRFLIQKGANFYEFSRKAANKQSFQLKDFRGAWRLENLGNMRIPHEIAERAIFEFRADGTYSYQGNKFQQFPDHDGNFEIKLDEQGLPCIHLDHPKFEMAPFQVHRFNRHFIGFANAEMKGRQTDWLFRLS